MTLSFQNLYASTVLQRCSQSYPSANIKTKKNHLNFNLCTSFMSPPLDYVSLFLHDLVKISVMLIQWGNYWRKVFSWYKQISADHFISTIRVLWNVTFIDGPLFRIFIFIQNVLFCMHTHSWRNKSLSTIPKKIMTLKSIVEKFWQTWCSKKMSFCVSYKYKCNFCHSF